MSIKPELLSPAGGWDALVAAVQNGADAVYLGGSRFSARAGAANFNDETMQRAVDYCHLRGVRIFVAVNTLIKQKEMTAALEYAAFLYGIGVDALIVQDIGLAKAVSERMPDFPLHASTQMTVHNIPGAKALERMGFRRIVLARELSAGQIRRIRQAVSAELEVFVHGALCCSFSGQCLLSSFLGGRSGNRGRCAQPCRLPYTLERDGKTIKSGYLLSPKDLCLLGKLCELEDMGIDSLKIEGRLKRAEYVAIVTQIYRKYIDSGRRPNEQDLQTLMGAFNRSGFTDGYFSGKIGASMMSFQTPSNVADESFPKNVAQTFLPQANFRKVAIRGRCVITAGHSAVLELFDGDGNAVKAEGFTPTDVPNPAFNADRVRSQLLKFGATPFRLDGLELSVEDGIAMPVSEINALRRDAAEKLAAVRVMSKRRQTSGIDPQAAVIRLSKTQKSGNRSKPLDFTVDVRTLQQAEAVLSYQPLRLYVPPALAGLLGGRGGRTQVVAKLPDIMPDDADKYLNNLSAEAVCTGIFGLGCELATARTVYGDFRLNLCNTHAAFVCLQAGFKTVTLSCELDLKEIADLCAGSTADFEVIAYGHLPLMMIKNCVIRSCGGKCDKAKEGYCLADRKKERLPLICEPHSCSNLLLNAKPVYMADKLADIQNSGVHTVRLQFTVENAARCDKIMRAYTGEAQQKDPLALFEQNGFTRGHFYRGVE